jgi:hypothetical protein
VKFFLKGSDDLHRELQRFNVTRDFEYHTVKRYKETGCIENAKTQAENQQSKTIYERIGSKCDCSARNIATRLNNKTVAKRLERSKVVIRWYAGDDIVHIYNYRVWST